MKASPNLVRDKPSTHQVERLIRSVEIALSGGSDMGDISGVCSFTFADLRHNGIFSLIAGGGVANRHLCTSVYILDKTSAGFEEYQSGGDGSGGNVASNIVDLAHVGHLEILLFSPIAAMSPGCEATWTSIFAWTGKGYTNVSDHFNGYYQRELERLEKIVRAKGPDQAICSEAVVAKIKRFLGIENEAGLEQALSLAKSTDRFKREFAVQLLIQFGDSKAWACLRKLANDSDSVVAYEAKTSLAQHPNGGPVNVVSDSFEKLAPQ